MEALEQMLFDNYKESNRASYVFLTSGIEVLKSLVSHSFEAFIIGQAVSKLFIQKPITEIKIVTNATFEDLKKIFVNVIRSKEDKVYLKEKGGIIYFVPFSTDLDLIPNEASDYYNKKLAATVVEEHFTLNGLILSPNQNIIDIFDAQKALQSKKVLTISKSRNLFANHPEAILTAFEIMADYGFELGFNVLSAIKKESLSLSRLKDMVIIRSLKKIIESSNSNYILNVIKINKIFKHIPAFNNFVEKSSKLFNKLNSVEKSALLYLILGSIPDASYLSEVELKDITETMTFAQLLMNDSVTPMMIYNIGEKMLLSANRVAKVFKNNYKSQEGLINKLSKDSVINNIRELNITELEIISILNGERSIKVKVVQNLLLEKVINGQIINHSTILKKEALNILKEMDEIFNYTEPSTHVIYNEELIASLLEKYDRELKFLVKVYLNDEKELYSLSALERVEAEKNASKHAKEFLLATSQYKILENRGLI